MNSVTLTGRLTRDPQIRYAAQSQMAVANFTLAVDRARTKEGQDRDADFPDVVAFGKTAEIIERYAAKGSLIGVSGRLQTRTYEKDGRKVYVTEVVAERVELLSCKPDDPQQPAPPGGFERLEDDPFGKFTEDDLPF
jgi:single-strand DNA-binding protein